MIKILVDTSIWIDALNGKKNSHVTYLEGLLEADASLVTCPTVIQEILQGIKDDKKFNETKEALSGFETLMIDPIESAQEAAALYRSIRKKGGTIRKSNDCLIAYYAIHHKAELLHKDRDFDLIAKHSHLKLHNF